MEQSETNPQDEKQQAVAESADEVEVMSAVEVIPSLEELLKEAERKAQEHYDAQRPRSPVSQLRVLRASVVSRPGRNSGPVVFRPSAA